MLVKCWLTRKVAANSEILRDYVLCDLRDFSDVRDIKSRFCFGSQHT